MATFKLRESAENDLVQIGIESREQFGHVQMQRYLTQLDGAFHVLAASPRIGRAIDDVRRGVRRFPQGSHLIFYRLTEAGDVDIIRILHASMDHEAHLDDGEDDE